MTGSIPNIMRPAQYALDELIAALPAWGDATMVEIGCYQGESTEAFMSSGKFRFAYAVDPWSNETYDPNDKATMHCDMAIVERAFERRMGVFYPKIHKLKMHSKDAARLLNAAGPFLDFVYIDGNHKYEAVKEDITLWRPLIKPGGIIAGHDYGTHPGPVKAVNEIFGRPHRVFKDYSWMVQL